MNMAISALLILLAFILISVLVVEGDNNDRDRGKE
jgi:hypothetical protein